MFARVQYTLENIDPSAVWENVIIAESQWAVPRQESYKSCLRKVYKDYKTFKSSANKLKKHLLTDLSAQVQYTKFVEALSLSSEAEELGNIQVYG